MNGTTAAPTLNSLINTILESRRITRHDQNMLMTMVHSANLGDMDVLMVNRLHDELRRGFLKVMD